MIAMDIMQIIQDIMKSVFLKQEDPWVFNKNHLVAFFVCFQDNLNDQ